MNQPMISVIMPVYNGEKYLNKAIESILNQTYTNFEFIILNDGSTDKTEEIIQSYNDPRIVYRKNEKNLRIVKTLNKGLALAKSKYIARMDSDDISLPERFEKQLAFMESNPDVGVCGTWLKTFGDANYEWSYLVDSDQIKVATLFFSPLAHPTVMMRKFLLNDVGYDEAYNKAEDYYLWSQLVHKTEFHNISEYLFYYRLHLSQSSTTSCDTQLEVSNHIRFKNLECFGVNFNLEELETHIKISRYQLVSHIDAYNWLLKLLTHNKKTNYYDQKAFERFVRQHWFRIISMNSHLGLKVLIFYLFKSKIPTRYSFVDLTKLLIKCLIKWHPSVKS